jgi:hypothetical protein
MMSVTVFIVMLSDIVWSVVMLSDIRLNAVRLIVVAPSEIATKLKQPFSVSRKNAKKMRIILTHPKSHESLTKGIKHSTVYLLVLSNIDQPLFILKTLFSFTEQATLMRRLTVLRAPRHSE